MNAFENQENNMSGYENPSLNAFVAGLNVALGKAKSLGVYNGPLLEKNKMAEAAVEYFSQDKAIDGTSVANGSNFLNAVNHAALPVITVGHTYGVFERMGATKAYGVGGNLVSVDGMDIGDGSGFRENNGNCDTAVTNDYQPTFYQTDIALKLQSATIKINLAVLQGYAVRGDYRGLLNEFVKALNAKKDHRMDELALKAILTDNRISPVIADVTGDFSISKNLEKLVEAQRYNGNELVLVMNAAMERALKTETAAGVGFGKEIDRVKYEALPASERAKSNGLLGYFDGIPVWLAETIKTNYGVTAGAVTANANTDVAPTTGAGYDNTVVIAMNPRTLALVKGMTDETKVFDNDYIAFTNNCIRVAGRAFMGAGVVNPKAVSYMAIKPTF